MDKTTGLERKSSFLSDGTFESISESETSTAPSSLQTIVRAPYANSLSHYAGMSEYNSSNESSSPVQVIENDGGVKGKLRSFETTSQATESEAGFSSANNLRKVSEQILTSSRTRSSLASSSRPGSIAVAVGSPRDPTTSLKIPPPAGSTGHSSSSGSDSRPGSQLSLVLSGSRPSSRAGHPSRIPGLPSVPGRELRPHSVAGPPNTVGLPAFAVLSPGTQPPANTPSPRTNSFSPSIHFNNLGPTAGTKFQSKLPRLAADHEAGYPESSGLLSTISQAALSDDESPPATHVPSPPKFNTASLARTVSKIPAVQPNYENVETGKQSTLVDNPAKFGIPRPESTGGISRPMKPPPAGQQGMTQGQFRAAASQAKVATIPEDPGTYMPMGVRKGVMVVPKQGSLPAPQDQKGVFLPTSLNRGVPLATSSPSLIPTYSHNINGNK